MNTMELSAKLLRSTHHIKHILLFNALAFLVFLFVATWGEYSTKQFTYKTKPVTIYMADERENGAVNISMEQQKTNKKLDEHSVSTDDPAAVGGTETRQKITHIGFLKVHKAGSTTMQNMFLRFGLKHNLTFVLPKPRNYFLKTSQALPVAPGNHRDILACHSVYSRKLWQSVLSNDTVNIGIIREPFERMISAAFYFRDVWHSRVLSKIPRQYFIHSLILHPNRYDPLPFSKTKNAMGKDFGFPEWVKEKDTKIINAHLNMLRADFRLVMVMERFEESLVLLKRDLNWSLSDIIYIQSNSHTHTPVSLNDTELEMFKSINFLDYAIYNMFYKIFDERVRRERRTLQPEVDYLKIILGKVKVFCTDKEHTHASLEIQNSIWNEAFTVTLTDCLYMEMEEMKFINRLKLRHSTMNSL